MTYQLTTHAPQALQFHHEPGSFRPLEFDSSSELSDGLLGWFLAEAWNNRPLELMDAVIDHCPFRWGYWDLHFTRDKWKLVFHLTSAYYSDDSLRQNLVELASDCLADSYLELGPADPEADALDHRVWRLSRPFHPTSGPRDIKHFGFTA